MCFFARHLFVKLRNRPSIARKMSQKVNSLRGHGQGGLGLLVKQVLSRKTRGIGLVETLVAGAIGSVIIAGSMRSLQIAVESSQVAHTTLSEAEFRQMINQFFTPDNNQKCLDNFKRITAEKTGGKYNVGVFGDNSEWGVGEVFKLDTSIPLVKGKDFKGDLEIVKMELRGEFSTTPPGDADDPTKTTSPVDRHFVVFYKKIGMGSYSTVGTGKCQVKDTAKGITTEDLTGCYVNHCPLSLKLADPDKECKSPCSLGSSGGGGGGGGGGNPDCFKVDDDSTTGKTLVGCGNTKNITATGTTAIGYNAGQGLASTASFNTFLGVGAGYGTLSGQSNVFVGWGAGSLNSIGSDNTFIGRNAGYNDPSMTGGRGSNNIVIGSGVKINTLAENQINIGNIIKAEQEDKSDTDSTQIGVLKVCNADGSECLPLSKKSFTCPDKDGAKQFFRGFKDDGTPLCEKERCTPQTGIYFWKPENQCHHCPRASPLWKPNANPPSCGHCFANSRYVLANNRCRSTCPSYQTNNNGVCTCPTGRPHHTGSACVPCTGGKVWNTTRKKCLCPPRMPYTITDNDNSWCSYCPEGFVANYISKHNYKCCRIGHSPFYQSIGKCCPDHTRPSRNDSSKCCPPSGATVSRFFSNGKCCPGTHPHHSGGVCCRGGYYGIAGGCCRDGLVYSNGVCCPTGSSHWLSNVGYCCPIGYTYQSHRKCCPNSHPNLLGGNCCKAGDTSITGWRWPNGELKNKCNPSGAKSIDAVRSRDSGHTLYNSATPKDAGDPIPPYSH